MKILEKISIDLNLPEDLLADAIQNSRDFVKLIRVPKKDKTYRRVYQPSKKLKVIQYWLLNNVFSSMEIHKSAMAYLKKISIKNNAAAHISKRYLLKLDFTDFFPSLKYKDFEPLLDKWYKNTRPQWMLDQSSHDIVKRSCFYKKNRLPIGYPTSPILSNIIMYTFDTKVIEILEENKSNAGKTIYTRYADDMIFSTNKKGGCKVIYGLIRELVKNTKSPSLSINNNKTRFVSKSGGSAVVTGLRLCYDGHSTLHRNYKDKVRLLLSLYAKNELKNEEIASLQGHIAYIKGIDSAFYTKLQKKYFKSIDKLTTEGQ